VKKPEKKKRRPGWKGPSRMAIVHKGDAFSSQGLARYAKDVVRVGEWIHPRTGQRITFDASRLAHLVENTEKYLAAGNKIPFPDGHEIDSTRNLGFWPGPFIVHQDQLVGVVEAKSQKAVEGIEEGTLDAVSVNIDFDHKDPKGNEYDEVITHICATNYPVVTEQREFVRLSQETLGERELYMPADDVADDVDAGDDLQPGIDRLAEALSGAPAATSTTKPAPTTDEIAAAFAELAKST